MEAVVMLSLGCDKSVVRGAAESGVGKQSSYPPKKIWLLKNGRTRRVRQKEGRRTNHPFNAKATAKPKAKSERS